MSLSRTQRLLALVVALVASAGESGAASPYASPTEAGARWLAANQNLDGSSGQADAPDPLCTAEAQERHRALNLRLSACHWGLARLENAGLADVELPAPCVVVLAAAARSAAIGTSFLQSVQNGSAPGVRDPGHCGVLNHAAVTSRRRCADETTVSGPAPHARAWPSKGRDV